jgi:hypothetical protein
MGRVPQCVISFFLLLGTARAQQIGSVDLSKPVQPSKSSEDLAQTKKRNGCSSLTPGIIADGVMGYGQQPREIAVKMVSVNDENPMEGSILQGEVELRNVGTEAIQIPWSTDSGVIQNGQDPNHLSWEDATFEILIKSHREDVLLLKSLTTKLYGSKFTVGSMLTIRPGQWVTATVRFKLEAMYLPVPGEFKDGPLHLFAEWKQEGRGWSVKNCMVNNSYFRYDDLYSQQKSSVMIATNGASPPMKSSPQ